MNQQTHSVTQKTGAIQRLNCYKTDSNKLM